MTASLSALHVTPEPAAENAEQHLMQHPKLSCFSFGHFFLASSGTLLCGDTLLLNIDISPSSFPLIITFILPLLSLSLPPLPHAPFRLLHGVLLPSSCLFFLLFLLLHLSRFSRWFLGAASPPSRAG